VAGVIASGMITELYDLDPSLSFVEAHKWISIMVPGPWKHLTRIYRAGRGRRCAGAQRREAAA
jgi:hypothetical protein